MDSGTRTVICDQDGYVLAESVYRCLKCPTVLSSVSSAQRHYYACHMTDERDNEIEDPFFGADNWSDGRSDGRVASSALTDTHPNVVKALTSPFSPVAESSSSHQSLAVVPDGTAANASGKRSRQKTVRPKSGHSERQECAMCGVMSLSVANRSGRKTCQVCYRFYRTFFKDPIRFSCPTLGSCSLNVRDRCKACWIKRATQHFELDQDKRDVYQKYGPQVTGLKTEDQSMPMPPPLQFHPMEPENQAPIDLTSGQKTLSPKKKNLPVLTVIRPFSSN